MPRSCLLARYYPSKQASPTWRGLPSPPLGPITSPYPSLVMPHQHRRMFAGGRNSARLTARDSQQSQRGDSLGHLYPPPALMEEKFSGVFSATPEDTISLVAMLGTIAAISPRLWDPLISERNLRSTDDPLDPAIKLLDQDIQQHLQREA